MYLRLGLIAAAVAGADAFMPSPALRLPANNRVGLRASSRSVVAPRMTLASPPTNVRCGSPPPISPRGKKAQRRPSIIGGWPRLPNITLSEDRDRAEISATFFPSAPSRNVTTENALTPKGRAAPTLPDLNRHRLLSSPSRADFPTALQPSGTRRASTLPRPRPTTRCLPAPLTSPRHRHWSPCRGALC